MAKSNDLSRMQSKPNILAYGEFTETHSLALQSLIQNLSQGTVLPEVSWEEGSELATVNLPLKSSCGKVVTVRIRGEYLRLRERILYHLQSQESRIVTELEGEANENA